MNSPHVAQLHLSCLQPLLALVQVQMSSEKIFILTVGLPPRHRAFEHKADPKLLEAVEAQLKALPGQLADAGIEAKNVFMGPGVCYWPLQTRAQAALGGTLLLSCLVTKCHTKPDKTTDHQPHGSEVGFLAIHT